MRILSLLLAIALSCSHSPEGVQNKPDIPLPLNPDDPKPDIPKLPQWSLLKEGAFKAIDVYQGDRQGDSIKAIYLIMHKDSGTDGIFYANRTDLSDFREYGGFQDFYELNAISAINSVYYIAVGRNKSGQCTVERLNDHPFSDWLRPQNIDPRPASCSNLVSLSSIVADGKTIYYMADEGFTIGNDADMLYTTPNFAVDDSARYTLAVNTIVTVDNTLFGIKKSGIFVKMDAPKYKVWFAPWRSLSPNNVVEYGNSATAIGGLSVQEIYIGAADGTILRYDGSTVKTDFTLPSKQKVVKIRVLDGLITAVGQKGEIYQRRNNVWEPLITGLVFKGSEESLDIVSGFQGERELYLLSTRAIYRYGL